MFCWPPNVELFSNCESEFSVCVVPNPRFGVSIVTLLIQCSICWIINWKLLVLANLTRLFVFDGTDMIWIPDNMQRSMVRPCLIKWCSSIVGKFCMNSWLPITLFNLLKLHSSILSFYQVKLLPVYYLISVSTQSLNIEQNLQLHSEKKLIHPASLLLSIWHWNLLSLVMGTDLWLEIWLRSSNSHSLSKALHLP